MSKKLIIVLSVICILGITGAVFLIPKDTHKPRRIEDTYTFSRVDFNNTTFDIAKIEPESIPLIKFYYKDTNSQQFGTIVNLRNWLKDQGEKLIFATNGGIFSEAYVPLGLYIEHGTEISTINTSTGEGNFYLKPNGIFAITNGKGGVIETSAYPGPDNISFAVQSGPLLVQDNKINPLFDKDSQNTYIRSGVGVAEDGSVIFAISNEPVSFYQFASLFKEKLGIRNALYLDGFISEMYVPKYRKKTSENLSVILGISLK